MLDKPDLPGDEEEVNDEERPGTGGDDSNFVAGYFCYIFVGES